MNQESVVYGCIKDVVYTSEGSDLNTHREHNKRVMQSLPSIEDWPLISREMFSAPVQFTALDDVHTDVVHFGISYKAVEHEWQSWLNKFEDMLKQMYWVSAVVHLETEYSGTHTFTWDAEDDLHEPSVGELSVRCEWSREAVGF